MVLSTANRKVTYSCENNVKLMTTHKGRKGKKKKKKGNGYQLISRFNYPIYGPRHVHPKKIH